MIDLRPDWTKRRYDDDKINLANNLCYDIILNSEVDQIIKNTQFDIRQYPDEAIAYDILSSYHSISSKNIAIGYGIGEIIQRLLKLEQGQISIPSPTWPMVEVFSNIYNLNYTTTYLESADIVYLANPNGMTGKYKTPEDIESLCNIHKLVIIDEAYADFCDISVVELVNVYDNLIILKTLSKTLSLAGLRFGYAISSKEIIKELQLVRPSCVVSGFAIGMLEQLLQLIPSHVERMIETRSFIESTFNCIPSNGNYVLFSNCPQEIKDTFIVKEINGVTRMALTNKELIEQCLTNI